MMLTDMQTLQILQNKDFDGLWNNLDDSNAVYIQNIVGSIPNEYFEPRICSRR